MVDWNVHQGKTATKHADDIGDLATAKRLRRMRFEV